MRALSLGQPLGSSTEARVAWLVDAVKKIELASNERYAETVPIKPITGLTNVKEVQSALEALMTSTVIRRTVTARVATTASITIASALNAGDTIDGKTLVAGDLVLVKDQSSGSQNGIIVAGATPARHFDFDTYDEHAGLSVVVSEGTVNGNTVWLCTSDAGGTLDTTAIRFAQITPGIGTYYVNVFGAVGKGVTDDTAAIQAAIDAAVAAGGGVIYFGAGTYLISDTLNINYPGIKLVGVGHDRIHTVNGPWDVTQGNAIITTLFWDGADGGKMIYVRPVAGSESAIGGVAVMGINLIGSDYPHTTGADYGLFIEATQNSDFDVYVSEFQEAGIWMAGVDNMGSGEGSCTFNTFHKIVGRQVSAPGSIVRLDGVVGSDCYFNTFHSIDGLHDDGHGLDLWGNDNNVFERIAMQRTAGGTGYGVYNHASSYSDGPSRQHTFGVVYAGPGGFYVGGTEDDTYPCTEILIENWNRDNSPPDAATPIIGDDASCFWHKQRLPVHASLAPYAYPVGFDIAGTYTTATNLAVVAAGVGGAIAIPIFVPSEMRLQRAIIRSGDTANLRTAEWGLYLDMGDNTQSVFKQVASGTWSFTPTVASDRASAATVAPTEIAAGVYWLVIRNTSTAQTFGIDGALPGSFGRSINRTNAALAALGTTIDISAWSGSSTSQACRLDGRIGAEAAAFG